MKPLIISKEFVLVLVLIASCFIQLLIQKMMNHALEQAIMYIKVLQTKLKKITLGPVFIKSRDKLLPK